MNLHIRRRASFTIGGLVALVATSVLLATNGNAKDESKVTAPRPALTVKITQPTKEKWSEVIAVSGGLAPWQEAVIAAETGGLRIEEIYADVGSVVKRGQKLAVLAQDIAQADLEQQQARVAQAKADLSEAKANADRARKLQGENVMSDQQITQYLTGEERAKANLDAALALLRNQQIRLDNTKIIAIDDGVVSSRSATLGAVVQAGTELFRIVRQNRIEWRAEVMADQVARVKSGQTARLQLTTGDTIEGTVRIVAPTFDATTRKTLVYVDLPTNSPARAGMFARGELVLGASEATSLPQSAVVFRDGFSYVFEITPDQHVSQRKVVTGRRRGDRVEIISGIDGNPSIVTAGGAFLNDGDLVRVEDTVASQARVNP